MGTRRPYSAHILAIHCGLWGNPTHVDYLREAALAAAAKSGGDSKLVVLNAKSNAVDWTWTYDGIDVCADRVVEEIDAEIKRIEADGGTVDKFSMVGYSLGGLVARYTIGLLDSRTPSFFDKVEPVNFTTFASPAIGIPHYRTPWSTIFRFLGARMLSRTGEQLYERDRFLPSRFNPDASSPPADAGAVSKCGGKTRLGRIFPSVGKGKEKAEPLLKIMADPRYAFYRALSKFEKIDVYANTMNDRTVPFITGAFEAHDPFALARAKAQKIAEKRGDDPEKELDLREGGIDITLRKDAPIVSTYTYVPPPSPSRQKPTPAPLWSRLKRRAPSLPMLLRPSSYPVARWKAAIVVVALPVILPCFVAFMLVRFSLHGRQSRRRISETRKARAEGREGMLKRVGFEAIARVLQEEGGVENPEYAGGLQELGRDQGASAATSGAATPVSTNEGESTPLNGNSGKTGYGSSSSASASASASASTTSSSTAASSSAPPTSRHNPLPSPSSSDLSLAHTLRTDPSLTPSQAFQLENLNALPQLRKHFVHLPGVRHTHGVIVRRDPNWVHAPKGRKIVEAWAREAKW
ncbi:hypothetical protein JCM6882_004130 [Rhodosporidiobolus microsporus]